MKKKKKGFKSIITLALSLLLILSSVMATGAMQDPESMPPGQITKGLEISNLKELTPKGLKSRSYGSTLLIVEDQTQTLKSGTPIRENSEPLFAQYQSDGLRNYARIDIPSTIMPETGYPIVIFAHGWVGITDAPTWHFGESIASQYGDMIIAYRDMGYVVLTPGFRGHGTIGGVPAEGIEFMSAFDNASYLSPMFYAIDILNLLEGVDSLENIDWEKWSQSSDLKFNFDNINLVSHSQGGDAALTALAVAGEGTTKNEFSSGSMWAGCFPVRDEQVRMYAPMEKTFEAFMSGDGTWTKTAIGANGEINPNFVFAWPPTWIGTMDSTQWGNWQNDYFGKFTYEEIFKERYEKMYSIFNTYVKNLDKAEYSIEKDENGRVYVNHDKKVKAVINDIGAFNSPEYITERLMLHFSNQDFYSIPQWNYDLAAKVNAAGGEAYAFEYEGNTHGIKKSEYEWFSPIETIEGYSFALQRDHMLFSGENPEEIVVE